jgi:segregation and condensation protein B
MLKVATTLADALAQAASTVRTDANWSRRLVSAPRQRGLGRGQGTRDPRFASFPGARSPKLARVEAALFAAGEPLSTRRIADAANLADGAEARVLVQELKALYDADGTAFTVENVAGGWQLRTRPEFAPWLQKLHSTRQETRLSQPALETLAVVAYRQPILRTDVESIRGVQCGEMLRQLIDRGLVRITGHHDSLGRPLLYGTTRKFLETFGLADLADLPMSEQLRAPAQEKKASVDVSPVMGQVVDQLDVPAAQASAAHTSS